MRVINNDRVFFVGWQYDNAKDPTITHCILRDSEKNEITRVSVVRYYKDPQSKDKARKFSLNKLLHSISLSKEERREFWEAYLHRNDVVMKPTVVES